MTIKLQAPSGVVGIVQTSTGNVYTIATDGTIAAVAGDVLPLLQAGWTYGSNVAVAAAAGTIQGDATALTADVSEVTGADGTVGVKLAAFSVNSKQIVINTDATHVLKVYPALGGTINALSANAAFLLGPGEAAAFYGTSATQGYAAPATIGAEVIGVAAGYAIARGTASITGATGGDIATGLATVTGVSASLGEDAALTGSSVTAALGSSGHITLKVWKPTGSTDTTPILATAAKVVNWVAVGTL